jgi:hypothetical protein
MEKLQDILKALAKVPGAESLAQKALEALKAEGETADEAKAEIARLKRDLAAAEKARDALKKDLESSTTGKDEAVKAAQAERDALKQRIAELERERDNARKRAALGDALGIADPVRRKHALDALLARLPEDVVLDDKGELVGATKAVAAFRAEAPFYWPEGEEEEAPKDAGGSSVGRPANAGKAPLRRAGPGPAETTREERIRKWDRLFGRAPEAKQH